MTDKATHTPLPCPFCGAQPRIMERPQSGKDTGFFCSISCFCGKYSTRAHQHGIAETEESARAEALTAWNTRAVNSHHELIEALRGLLDEIGKSACADTILDSAAAGKAFAAIAEVEGRRG